MNHQRSADIKRAKALVIAFASLVPVTFILVACSSNQSTTTPVLVTSVAANAPQQPSTNQVAALTIPEFITSNSKTKVAYDQLAAVLTDPASTFADRRNKLRVLRSSLGDKPFFAVLDYVPVFDQKTGRTVRFSDYMTDLAATYVGDPGSPISFDPVGGATSIYLSPTEETIRNMTGIGLPRDRIVEAANAYRSSQRALHQSLVAAFPKMPVKVGEAIPAFIANDQRLSSAYEQVKTITTNPNLTQAQRTEKLRVVQDSVGADVLTSVIRYVPIYDPDAKKVTSFDSYIRTVAPSYGGQGGAPIDVDPVGAAVKIFLDPSESTTKKMTGIGLSSEQKREAVNEYQRDSKNTGQVLRQAVKDARSEFDWNEVKGGLKDLWSAFDK